MHVDRINRAAAGGVVLQTRLVLGSEWEGPGPHSHYLPICSKGAFPAPDPSFWSPYLEDCYSWLGTGMVVPQLAT